MVPNGYQKVEKQVKNELHFS